MAAADDPFRNLGFAEYAAVFASASQNVRVPSEGGMVMHGFCPSCGAEPLAALYPDNHNVRPKIRQQLQVLRDRGWLEFTARRVTYRRTHRA